MVRIRNQIAVGVMEAETAIERFRLQVTTKLDDLREVLQWFEANIKPKLPQRICWECEVALAEGFTNAVRHAHHNLPTKTGIDLEITLFPETLEICICDQGEPFDLEEKLRSLHQQKNFDPLEQEGGRGLFFMEQLTDELRYVRLPNQHNCLRMRKILKT
ncbi:MAG: ATP-binding protein [Chroococcales cyanobacterium]